MSHVKVKGFITVLVSLTLTFSCSRKSIEKVNYGEWAVHYNAALGKFAKNEMAPGMQRVIKETYPNKNSKNTKCQVIVTEKETILGMRGNLVQTFRERTYEQIPKEDEAPRINFSDLSGYNDPLTSFLNVLINSKSVNTIDGRRIYSMKKNSKEDNLNKVSIQIKEYKNIWADHDRNDLKKIEFFLEDNNFLPLSINIFYKKRVFKFKKI